MTGNITKLKKIKVNSFRGLKNIDIEIADRVTIICGKNGTSKSTILGLIAQIFSFEKDYVLDQVLEYQTLSGRQFKSNFSEHFRFSPTFDTSGSMDVEYDLYEAYLCKDILKLKLELVASSDRRNARPVVRNNLPAPSSKNTSRNVTHPVIYLSLNRLMPIAERSKYAPEDIDYLNTHKHTFKALSNELLGKQSGVTVTATTGTVSSAVVHGDTYDYESVSAGEDNAGQILMALLSFQRLKESYDNYHGGILLIDEADAGLFPAAQKQLISIFNKLSKKLDLQIVFTTHSPIIIQDVYEKSLTDTSNFKTIFLTDTYGAVEKMENVSWDKINADLNIETIQLEPQKNFPKINIYFEDDEAYQFFNVLIRDRKTKKIINPMKDITLGCANYIQLINKKIPEFSRNSLIVLDGDEQAGRAFKNVVHLPTVFPPDQLIFDYFYQLPDGDSFWRSNKYGFTKSVFIRIAQTIISELELPPSTDPNYDLRKILRGRSSAGKTTTKARELFKAFYKSIEIQQLIKGSLTENPFKMMMDRDPEVFRHFANDFKASLAFVVGATHPSQKLFIKTYLGLE